MLFTILSHQSLPFLFWAIMPKNPLFFSFWGRTQPSYFISQVHLPSKGNFFLTRLKIKLKKATKKKKSPPKLPCIRFSFAFWTLCKAHTKTQVHQLAVYIWSPGRICFFLCLGWYPADKSESQTYIKMHKKSTVKIILLIISNCAALTKWNPFQQTAEPTAS